MLDKIKFRITVVVIAIGLVLFFWTIRTDTIQPYGDALAANPDNSVLWGFTWLTQNIGWVVLLIVIAVFVILMAWQIRKDRGGRG